MAIGTTATYKYAFRTQDGALIRVAKVAVTGLAVGNNIVPHGLTNAATGAGVTPVTVGIEPTSAGTLYEYQAADATNVYINAQNANQTCDVYFEY